jgi:ketosteroid isomerase-like protein
MYCVPMGEADVEALKRGYAALNRGDLSVVLDLLDPEIEWQAEASPSRLWPCGTAGPQ